MSVTGEFPHLVPGASIEVHGSFRTHPKYGVGFKADAYSHCHDGSPTSLSLYLQSIAKWIGPERSVSLVKHFGAKLEETIETCPEKLAEVDGIGQKIAQSIVEAWSMNRNLKDVQIFLHGLGLSELKIRRILTSYGPDSESVLKDNPWKLLDHGFGFSTCDVIAEKLGKEQSGALRWRSLALYALRQCSSSGHLYLLRGDFIAAFNAYNRGNPWPLKDGEIAWEDVSSHVDALVSEGTAVVDGERIYDLNLFFYENESARLVHRIMGTKDTLKLDTVKCEEFIVKYEQLQGITLSDAQKDAIRLFLTEKVLIITGSPGTGKCLGKDTPVLMFDGTVKAVQDIVVGDYLMGDDSTPRTVLSVCSGREELYKVTPTKGDAYVVNKSHMLSLKNSPNGRSFNRTVIDISVLDYLKLPKYKHHHLKGYRVKVAFSQKEAPIDPYLIGYWLGDGCSAGSRISTASNEVIEFLSKLVEQYGLCVVKVPGDNVDYNIRHTGKAHQCTRGINKKRNIFFETLKCLSLLNNKHIPLVYKTNSEENRLRLLAGIIDSDGYLDKSGTYDMTLKSHTLANDVVYLCRSLGFAAYIKPCKKSWNSFTKGKLYRGVGDYFRISISGNIEKIPTVISYKRANKRKQKKDVLVTGIKLSTLGIGDYYGFELDGNGRFLLGDFTVTHNTTIIKGLVTILKLLNASFELLTPTGISAKKLGTTAECQAYTIHRRLGYKGKSWDYNAVVKYPTQAVIIDETSMVDQEVFYRLLSALHPSTKLVFVGDNDQLPSVGPGSVLRELINSGQIKTIFLSTIFRQDKQSEIIKAAKKIRDGDQDLSYFKADKKSDIWFIPGRDPDHLERIVVKFAEELMQHNRLSVDKKHFQIITPRNEGPLSVDSLNIALQRALNPPASDKKEFLIGRVIIRKGDRVIIRKNNYELEVFNGDIGKVVFVTPDHVTVDVEDYGDATRRVDIPMRIADDMIRMAYAITVHRAQGLEYPLVIMPFIKAHGKMLLQRNLLYTALTRAKRKVIILGQASALEQAIANDKIQRRNTMFAERIRAWNNGQGTSLRTLFSKPEQYQNAENLRLLLSYEERG